VRASAAASGLPTEEIDRTVALIQALIPLGLQAVGEALDAEVTAWAGTRYCRTGGRPGVVRSPRKQSPITYHPSPRQRSHGHHPADEQLKPRRGLAPFPNGACPPSCDRRLIQRVYGRTLSQRTGPILSTLSRTLRHGESHDQE
jgi:hypothetical protein